MKTKKYTYTFLILGIAYFLNSNKVKMNQVEFTFFITSVPLYFYYSIIYYYSQ